MHTFLYSLQCLRIVYHDERSYCCLLLLVKALWWLLSDALKSSRQAGTCCAVRSSTRLPAQLRHPLTPTAVHAVQEVVVEHLGDRFTQHSAVPAIAYFSLTVNNSHVCILLCDGMAVSRVQSQQDC
jgi:hypothetical protein